MLVVVRAPMQIVDDASRKISHPKANIFARLAAKWTARIVKRDGFKTHSFHLV